MSLRRRSIERLEGGEKELDKWIDLPKPPPFPHKTQKSIRTPRNGTGRKAKRNNELMLAKYIKGVRRCFTTIPGKRNI